MCDSCVCRTLFQRSFNTVYCFPAMATAVALWVKWHLSLCEADILETTEHDKFVVEPFFDAMSAHLFKATASNRRSCEDRFIHKSPCPPPQVTGQGRHPVK